MKTFSQKVQSKIDAVINHIALEDIGLSPDTPITCHLKNISLRSFFGIVLGELELTHEIHDGALWITSKEEAETRMSVRTYPVTDLVRVSEDFGEAAYDYDSLIDLIRINLAPDSWDEVGGPGAIEGIYGTLVVTQVGEVHEQLAQFFAAFRLVVRQYEENPVSPGLPVFVGDSVSRERISAALEARTTLDIEDAPLSDVAEFLSKSADIPIVIDARALEEDGIESDVAVTARVNQLPMQFALHRLLDPHNLTWLIQNEVLSITTLEACENNLRTCIYPVYELVAPHTEAQPEEFDFDTLIDLLTNTVDPDQWDDVGGPATIEAIVRPPALVISHTESTHVQLRELMQKLRQAKQIEREVQELPPKGPSRLLIRTYSMQRGHDARDVMTLAVKLIGEDICEGEGVMIDVLGNEIVVRHDSRGQRRIESMLSKLGAWDGQWRDGFSRSGRFEVGSAVRGGDGPSGADSGGEIGNAPALSDGGFF